MGKMKITVLPVQNDDFKMLITDCKSVIFIVLYRDRIGTKQVKIDHKLKS